MELHLNTEHPPYKLLQLLASSFLLLNLKQQDSSSTQYLEKNKYFSNTLTLVTFPCPGSCTSSSDGLINVSFSETGAAGQWSICQHFEAEEELAYSPEQTMQHV